MVWHGWTLEEVGHYRRDQNGATTPYQKKLAEVV